MGGCAAGSSSENAEAAGWPVPYECGADDVAPRERAPDAAVLGALAVVAEHEIGVGRHRDRPEVAGDAARVRLAQDAAGDARRAAHEDVVLHSLHGLAGQADD